MNYLMQVVETAAQPALTMRKTTSMGEMPKLIGEIYGSITKYILEKGEEPIGPAFIAYYNMDMDHLIIDVGFPIQHIIEGSGEITLSSVPGGKKAIGFHKGPYDKVGLLYEQMTAWLSREGYRPTGVVYEYYYHSPEEVDSSELLTRVEFLLS
ncbi:MAG: GyrI-like domain-containing protein [Alkalibacterium sp.]|nr:GyrI-like domain-containing protein [Alkalibacterium sp.]